MKIAICGSSEFVGQMKEIADQLTANGHECFLPDPLISESDWVKQNSREKLLEMKPMFTQNHYKKIEQSDAVLIVNNQRKGHDAYIGSNTLMEIAVAFFLHKKIFFLNPIQENQPHYEELAGLKAIVLHGDLSKVA